MRIADIGEFGLIDRIAALTGPAPAGTVTGIGDDTAVLDTGGPRLLLATIDIQVEERHFIRDRIEPYVLGRRTAAINLSDIGAMGGQPRWALVSLALPSDLEVAWVEELYRGLREELVRFDAAVVGGNLSGSDRVVLDLVLLGDIERGRVLRRDGARPGDVVLVTGDLGASAAGRFALDAGLDPSDTVVAAAIERHLTPRPRVREGQAIASAGGATAMLDLSDGLAGDLRHITDASHAGARVDLARLPVTDATRAVAARLGLDPVRLAVAGGEDYELLFTAPPAMVESLRRAVETATGVPVTAIGEIVRAEAGCQFVDGDRATPVDVAGWDHFRTER
jgi:thiamine-monophosphate kinase